MRHLCIRMPGGRRLAHGAATVLHAGRPHLRPKAPGGYPCLTSLRHPSGASDCTPGRDAEGNVTAELVDVGPDHRAALEGVHLIALMIAAHVQVASAAVSEMAVSQELSEVGRASNVRLSVAAVFVIPSSRPSSLSDQGCAEP